MALDPECFRHMEPGEMLAALLDDQAEERRALARSMGARCDLCMDSGMSAGRFCRCSAGAALGMQSARP